MADLDDLREGADFGLGINCENQSFHVKGAENLPWGMKDRLSRIFNPKTGKAVMLAFDHGFIMGPTSGLERIDLNIVPLIEYADCLMYPWYPAIYDPCEYDETDLSSFGRWNVYSYGFER